MRNASAHRIKKRFAIPQPHEFNLRGTCMSSSTWNTGSTESGGTVAGYFTNGDDAHRAINELVEQGFSAREIGAAFHNGGLSRQSSLNRGVEDIEIASDESRLRMQSRSDTNPAGAASDTQAVSPWGLSTGGGTPISGATQPGPIPGSEIPPELPRDIPSELGSDAGSRSFSSGRVPVAETTSSTAGSTPREIGRESGKETWWDKLKHVFGGGEHTDTSARREPVSGKSAQNYGTGEGRLDLTSGRDYIYSGSAFESSFTGMGIAQDHARRLAHDLRRGGAVVTVRAGSRNTEAENIIRHNNGTVRYESQLAPESAREGDDRESRVEVFGEVYRVYPGYIPQEDVRSRKAS